MGLWVWQLFFRGINKGYRQNIIIKKLNFMSTFLKKEVIFLILRIYIILGKFGWEGLNCQLNM